MREILENITEGRGTEEDINLLEEMAPVIKETALCALGQTAPNPVMTTLQYFRDEYEAHVKEKRCPAYVCKALTSYYIDPVKCKACMLCLRNCPADAISGGKKQIQVIDQNKCTKCGTCYDVCPPKFSAVTRISGKPVPTVLPLEQRALIKRKNGA